MSKGKVSKGTMSKGKAILPFERLRRNTELFYENSSTLSKVKKYSRIITCIVLALSAATETVPQN
ncbi:Uncharacterized protein OBRU01_17679 [Operophtera brumata]|uniref:Uncharacterized protein n=1 Tax=Operophtera brumata TaxID=104452 RepID=A0A0L7L0N8_OPEBR|nr:Uncharacterized protein OBRU01_17679 [Operophtera brumata]